MKKTFSILCLVELALSVNGGTFTNESPAGMKIIWAVPTNVWPINGIWTYKVIPQTFASAVITNAMAIAGFTIKNKRELSDEEAVIDKNALAFINKDKTKCLGISSALGYITYQDRNADAKPTSAVKGVPEPVVGVPELPEATQLALKYARMLGLDVSLFARKRNTNDLDLHWGNTNNFDLHWIVTSRGWTNPKTKKMIEETNDFGVCFDRRIDGFPTTGFGDFEVDFGNNAKVSKIIVSWRGLEPYELHTNFVTPEQIVKSIADGKTRLPRIPEWVTGKVKTLTITNAIPHYSRGKSEDEPMDFVVPALQLDAIVGSEKTNMPIWFQTGIFNNP